MALEMTRLPPTDTTERTNTTTNMNTNNTANTTTNTYTNTIIKWGRMLFLILCVLMLLFIGYLLASNIVLDVGSMHVHKKDIQTVSVKFTIIDNTTVLFEANSTILVSFRVTGDIEPFAEMAYFNLSTTSIKLHPVSTFSKSSYQISEREQLPIVLKFSQHQTYLPEELLWLFEKRLNDDTEVWLELTGDFLSHIKKRRFLVIDHVPMHTKFTCYIPYNAFRYCSMTDQHTQECQILGNDSWCK